MLIVYSDKHRLHEGAGEFHRGRLVPCFEKPERADIILGEVRASGLGDPIDPDHWGLDPILRIHTADYVDFLGAAHDDWREINGDTDAVPHVWNVGRTGSSLPTSIYGKLGHYSCDAGTPITAGTWRAARVAADCALTAQRRVHEGAPFAFALTRPPGHHAGADVYGGYCFLNNAAIAAQAALDGGAARVAILDVDFHHGNGTQAIFYERADVLTVSIHGDPADAYPYFLGYADETGAGPGQGFNINFPLAEGTDWPAYARALDAALDAIRRFSPDQLILSLGVDTYQGDPISSFALRSEDFLELGRLVAGAVVPTTVIMEGGYAVGDLGRNVVNVLRGMEGQSR